MLYVFPTRIEVTLILNRGIEVHQFLTFNIKLQKLMLEVSQMDDHWLNYGHSFTKNIQH